MNCGFALQRAPINSLDRVKSAGEVVDEEGEWGRIAKSFVLLFSRSIEVGEKLGAGGSMLSHISLFFGHSIFLSSFFLLLGIHRYYHTSG